MSEIYKFLPPALVNELGQQFQEAVRRTELGFNDNKAEEDSVTGALGQSIRDNVNGTMSF